ncbi:Solute carrier organic anion transporter family member 4C1 [Eumeta japonica]|uniref:Solute carrier organic anion transporter family member 4C1 n=1 Tax=Eumeta variegata TaxID=151549 RepID=A0A4C1URJ0_EUMVA|nr:Solute carrier organic anion transporter family member 4C1 [Eumeta japonica]
MVLMDRVHNGGRRVAPRPNFSGYVSDIVDFACMVFIAGFIVILSSFMFLFPRQIRGEPLPPPPAKKKKTEPFFKDFFVTIKRQLTNDILMCRTASSVLHLMPISGIYSFLPKYLEKQFRLATHEANLVSGTGGILVMGLGIITSGVVILKMVPTARQVAAWTATTAAIYSAGMIILMFVSCPEENFRQLPIDGVNATLSCSSSCHCDGLPYSPVCGESGNFEVKIEPRSGRPVTYKVDAILEKVEQDQHISSYRNAEELGNDYKTVLIHFKKLDIQKKARYLGPIRAH